MTVIVCAFFAGAVVSTIMFVCDENAVGYGRYSLDSVGVSLSARLPTDSMVFPFQTKTGV